MRKEIIIPPGDGESHPLFNPLPFTYRVSYSGPKNKLYIIEYLTPHEIILNLKSFRHDDTITYVNRETGKDVFTLSFEKFNSMIIESMLDTSHSNLELLYGRLLLTNRFTKSISDRGQLWHYDQILRKYLLTIRGGIDSHIAYERHRVVLYLKYRRLSIHHLITTILKMMEEDDIQLCHISIPSTLENQGLLVELLQMDIAKKKFRIYSYDPIPEEDIIIPTNIGREIIQIIKQLIH